MLLFEWGHKSKEQAEPTDIFFQLIHSCTVFFGFAFFFFFF